MWYDSMTNEGKMDWQNALTEKNQDYLVDADLNPVADNMFLNFLVEYRPTSQSRFIT